jgi:hypothetical protein
MEAHLIDLLIIILAFWLGWKLRGFWMVIALAARPELLAEVARQAKNIADGHVDGPSRQIRAEQVGDCVFLYAEDTGEFLAQGTSLDLALATVKLRFPNQEFHGHIDPEQAPALGNSVK